MVILPFAAFPSETNCNETPFIDDGVMIRVPITVFGKTLYFSVDTGFSRTAMDSRYASLLGSALSTHKTEGPLGEMNGVALYHAPEISVGGQPLALKEIVCVNLQMARWVTGQSCDGILGIDGLSNLVVSVDFNRRMIALQDSLPAHIKRDFISAPLKNTGANFVLPLQVNGGRLFDLVVDTGDSSSVSFNAADWNEIFDKPSMNQATTALAGIGEQVVTSKTGVVPWISLENLNYTNLHATLIKNPTDLSHIGLAFFRRHDVVFDFPNRMLYLRPGPNFCVPDQEDMSGLHLLRHDGSTTVYSVDESSPASAGGIQTRDVLISVNGQDAAMLSMDALRRVLRSGDGQRIALQVKRGRNVLDCDIALKKGL